MRQLDFYKLPRTVQERFLGATKGTGAPAPLLFYPKGLSLPYGWALAVLVFAGVIVALLVAGFGKLDSSLALAPIWVLGVLAACTAGVTFCVLRIGARRIAHQQLPFRTGVFLFPVGVVVAESSKIREYSLVDLQQVTPLDAVAKVRLSFRNGPTFDFPLADRSQLSAAQEAILKAQQREQAAEAAHNEHDLATLDPLLDNGVPNPLIPEIQLTTKAPAWARLSIPVALALGLVLGWSFWRARNVLSERRMYSAARAENTVSAYRAYLALGGDRTDVSDLLLPRAELAESRQAGTVAAILKFIEEHPETRIQSEVTMALRGALLVELGQVKQKNSLTALREFAKRYKYGHLVQPEIVSAEDAVYDRALKKFKAVAAPGNEDLVPFFKKLISHSAKNGPKVEVRFRRLPTSSAEMADKAVRSNPYYVGPASLPSPYFEDPAARTREKKFAQAFLPRLQAVFPKDVLSFELAEALPTGKDDLPKPKVPTLYIEHGTTMSGSYFSNKPKAIYVGTAVTFRVTFMLPKSKRELKMKYSAWRPPDINTAQEEKLSHEQVYESMAMGAFEKFQAKLEGFFLKAEK